MSPDCVNAACCNMFFLFEPCYTFWCFYFSIWGFYSSILPYMFHFHVADLGTLQYLFPYVPMSMPNLEWLRQPSHLERHLLCMGSPAISGDIREPFSRDTGLQIDLHLKYSVWETPISLNALVNHVIDNTNTCTLNLQGCVQLQYSQEIFCAGKSFDMERHTRAKFDSSKNGGSRQWQHSQFHWSDIWWRQSDKREGYI